MTLITATTAATSTFAINNNWTSVCWSPELCLFAAVASTGYGNRVAISIDGYTWKIKKSAADNNWTSICWSSELSLFAVVASSGTGNRVMTSSDGSNWISKTSASNNNWTSVCWSPELMLFIAVSSDTTNNIIMKSSDGITWTSVTSPADNNWTSVIWISDLYIFAACASTGTNRLMYSLDGTNWNLLSTPSNNSWNCISWDYINSRLILISPESTNNIAISDIFKPNSNNCILGGLIQTDKATGYVSLCSYTTPTYQFEYTDNLLNSLYFYNSNSSNIYASLGVNIEGSLVVNTSNNKPILNIINHNGVDSGLALNGTLILATSTVLNSLTNITSGSAIASTPIAVDNNYNIIGLNQLSCTSLTLANPFNTITPGIAKALCPLITDSNINISNINKMSTNSLQINNININSKYNTLENNVMYNNTINLTSAINLNVYGRLQALLWIAELNKGIAVQYNGNELCYVSTTTNGTSWTTTSTAISVIQYCNSLIWSPTLNLCVATSISGSTISISSDLKTWTSITGFPYTEWKGCWFASANLFVIFGTNINTTFAIWTSPDGINWTGRNGPSGVQILNVAFKCCMSVGAPINKIFACAGSNIYYSSNGITWYTSSTVSTLVNIVYSPSLNLYIGHIGSNVFKTSSDALTWSSSVTGIGIPSVGCINFTYISSLDLFVATLDGGVKIVVSKNLTNWNVICNWNNIYKGIGLENKKIQAIQWAPSLNRFIFGTNFEYGNSSVAGDAIMGYTSSNQLSTKTYSDSDVSNTIDISNLNKAVKQSTGTVYNSLNTWYTRNSTADVNWRSVCWSSQMELFVAVGELQPYSYNGIMTSTDGKTWTQPGAQPTRAWTCVCYSPSLNRFVVLGNSTEVDNICFSDNGSNWTSYFGASTNSWTSVCWSPELTLFVAVASSGTGNRVMTSPNGLAWTSRTSVADNNWTSVCWSSELTLFVAVASSGTGNRVMTSPDGINWTSRTSIADNNWTSVCWNSDMYLFVAVASSGIGNRIMTSIDGITWVSQYSPADYSWNSIIYVMELNCCVAISNNTTNTTQNAIMISSNCYDWKLLSYRNSTSWTSICWSKEYAMFVTVSNTGTTNRVNNSKMAYNSTKNTIIANPNTINVNNSNGRVGLGVAAPAYQLQLSTDSAAKAATSTWTVSSDERLKNNIVDADLDMCYNNINDLRLVRYTWKDDVYTTEQVSDRSKLGWIAQEVETVFPKAVEKHDMHGYEDCRTLNNDQIIASLYGCIQKLIQKCETRQNTIDDLKSKYTELNTVFDNLEFVTE